MVLLELEKQLTVSIIRLRAPGSIGAASYPARVFKGMKNGWSNGRDRVKSKILQVLNYSSEKNLFVKGSVPGAKGFLFNN